MAISQARMLAVIDAGRDYRELYDSLCRALHARASAVTKRQLPAEQALDELTFWADTNRPKVQSIETLTAEYTHFKANWKRNDRERHRQQRKRGIFTDGVLESLNPPKAPPWGSERPLAPNEAPVFVDDRTDEEKADDAAAEAALAQAKKEGKL